MSPDAPLVSDLDESATERARWLAPVGGGLGGALGAVVGSTVATGTVDPALWAGVGAGLGVLLVWGLVAILE